MGIIVAACAMCGEYSGFGPLFRNENESACGKFLILSARTIFSYAPNEFMFPHRRRKNKFYFTMRERKRRGRGGGEREREWEKDRKRESTARNKYEAFLHCSRVAETFGKSNDILMDPRSGAALSALARTRNGTKTNLRNGKGRWSPPLTEIGSVPDFPNDPIWEPAVGVRGEWKRTMRLFLVNVAGPTVFPVQIFSFYRCVAEGEPWNRERRAHYFKIIFSITFW